MYEDHSVWSFWIVFWGPYDVGHSQWLWSQVCCQFYCNLNYFNFIRISGYLKLVLSKNQVKSGCFNDFLLICILCIYIYVYMSGNHDQVNLGGSVHALEPLRYAFRPDQILMISEPTVCLGALWIPYRRNAAVMKNVLSSVTGRNDISMIFCHGKLDNSFFVFLFVYWRGIDVGFCSWCEGSIHERQYPVPGRTRGLRFPSGGAHLHGSLS